MDKFQKVNSPLKAHTKFADIVFFVTMVMAVVLIFFATFRDTKKTADSITVTANMGSFSPNPVEVQQNTQGVYTGSSTSSLSASYSTPDDDPTFDEDNITEQYDWSVTSVQYKAVWFTSPNNVAPYGSPPSNSFTASISPTQPSDNSGATLTFTPEITGYWDVSVSCSVTVTDTDTNQSWSGSANAGPVQLTSYILHIQYGGIGEDDIIDNQTENVSVGEDTNLSADYSPTDMTLNWTIPGSIIDTYTADDVTSTITPVDPFEFTSFYIYYYWVDTDSGSAENEQVTLTGKLPSGGPNLSVSTTFNVYRPTWHYSTYYDTDGGIMLILPNVSDGNLGTDDAQEYEPGIEFDYYVDTGTQFTTNSTDELSTVQICDQLTVTTKQLNTNTNLPTTFEYSLPTDGTQTYIPYTLQGPLLDTSFPYGEEWPGRTSDTPDYHVDPAPPGLYGFGPGTWSTLNVTVSETFTHDLLFFPAVGLDGNYAPLSQVSWGWNAEVDNGVNLVSSAQLPPSAPSGTDLSTLPIWNNDAQPSWNYPIWWVPPN